jgi:hypothetical protein
MIDAYEMGKQAALGDAAKKMIALIKRHAANTRRAGIDPMLVHPGDLSRQTRRGKAFERLRKVKPRSKPRTHPSMYDPDAWWNAL